MSIYTYEMARQILRKEGIKTRDQYREFRKKNVLFEAKSPIEPARESAWAKDWVDWDEFLRNSDDVPNGAELLENHYYKYENSVYKHCGKGFVPIAKRQHPNGKWMSDIRLLNGKQKTIYLDSEAKPELDYGTAWKNYTDSNEYYRGSTEMIKNGMKQPYVDNILRGAFYAGFNSK